MAVGDAGPIVLGVGLESGVEGEGRGQRFDLRGRFLLYCSLLAGRS